MTNNVMAEIIDKVAAKADAALAPQNDEYLDEADGLLHCMTCHGKRQHRTMAIPELGISARIVRCVCSCQIAEQKRQDELIKRQVVEYQRSSKAFGNAITAKWTFEVDDRARPNISDALIKYAENFDHYRREGKGILLRGPVGTGKTFLAACVANRLIDKGYTVYMTNFATVADEHFDARAKREYIKSLCKYDLLVIDDLGAERKSEYMQELVFNVVDARYSTGRPMIITTNLTPAELTNSADMGYKRIYDRILERCLAVKVEGESRRRQIVKRDWNEMRQQLGMEA